MYQRLRKKKQILKQYWINENILYLNDSSKNKLPAAMYTTAIIV